MFGTQRRGFTTAPPRRSRRSLLQGLSLWKRKRDSAVGIEMQIDVRPGQEGVHPITGVPTSITAFVGRTAAGPVADPTRCLSFTDFERVFGAPGENLPLGYSVRGFFGNGGTEALVVRLESDGPLAASAYEGSQADETGIFALQKADVFNLLCIPPDQRAGDTPSTVYGAALTYCVRRRAMLIVDPPAAWSANPNAAARTAAEGLAELGLSGSDAAYAALYFPRVREGDGQDEVVSPSGVVAGAIARMDARRGVWKAPAGIDASLSGIAGIEVNITDTESEMLSSRGINCLRSFPDTGPVIWGAHTLQLGDAAADEYKYVPVRRLALYIEESVYRGTQWAVFEPNSEELWAALRRSVAVFMNDLHRQSAFAGTSPRDAYFVKCDRSTTSRGSIERGIVNIVVGFAPLTPADFVILNIQQIAGSPRS
jgi:Bacteriophage tail sheath protein